ncbi:MAG: restriction endonuclease subunit S [Acidobacteriota bacterium]|nr:restriction endonuclease subunit S [Acidobacteriota bacterium]
MSALRTKTADSDWPRVRLSDVADSIQYGHTASAIGRDKGPRFLRITDIQDGRVDWAAVPSCDILATEVPKYRLRSGDLVFARTGATTGKSYLIGDCPEAVFASYLIRVRVSTAVSARYLAAFFQSADYWQQIERGKRGIGQPNVNGRTLGDVVLPLPSIGVQQEVVAEIEKQFTRLDAGVAALRRVQANLKRYRAAVLNATFEGHLVPTEAEVARTAGGEYETGEQLLQRILTERYKKATGQRKRKEPAASDDAGLPNLPMGWTWANLDQLSWASSYGTSAKCGYENPGPAVLRIPNIANGRIDLADLKFAGSQSRIEKGDELEPGDLLIIRTNGSRNLIGRSAVVRQPLNPAATYASYLIRFRLVREPRLFAWLATIWNCSFLRAWIERRAATSAGQHNISMSVLATLPIPLPPINEQKRIADEVSRLFSVVDEAETIVALNLQRATRLRQSVLQRAFSGAVAPSRA